MSEYKKRLAERYLDKFHGKATVANGLFVAWGIALILIWLTGLEPKLEEVLDLRADESSLREQRGTYLGISTKTDKLLPAEIKKTIRAEGEKAIKESEDQLAKKRDTVKVAFKLPWAEFDVPTLYAPLIWQSLVLGLLNFLLHARVLLLRLAARATRLYLVELQVPETELQHYAGGAPWWIVPFPQQDGRVMATTYRHIVGLDQREWASYLFVVIFFIVLFALQARVASISWFITAESSLDSNPHFHSLAGYIYLLLLGSTICVVVRWFTIRIVPDHFPNEENFNAITRRGFLGYSGLIVSLVAILPVLGGIQALLRSRTPRFRRDNALKVISTDLAEGWYSNQRSTVIHRVLKGGLIHSSNSVKTPLNVRNLSSVSEDNVLLLVPNTKPRVNLSRSSLSLEQAALQKLGSGAIDEACRFLLAGIQYSLVLDRYRPNYRLYDLLASIAVRFKKEQYINDLGSLINRQHDPYLFRSRLGKWAAKTSSWRTRWSDTSKTIKWSGVPM